MRINSEASLRVAADTFRRFKGDWTAVHQAAEVDEDGILVIKRGTKPAAQGKDRRPAAAAARN